MKHNLRRPQQKHDMSFWQNKPLEKMTAEQWESLCDGCGICCLEKLEDTETGEVEYTAVACRHLDTGSCRCRIYERRHELNTDCIEMRAETIKSCTGCPTPAPIGALPKAGICRPGIPWCRATRKAFTGRAYPSATGPCRLCTYTRTIWKLTRFQMGQALTGSKRRSTV